jgi:hypothetical protein
MAKVKIKSCFASKDPQGPEAIAIIRGEIAQKNGW